MFEDSFLAYDLVKDVFAYMGVDSRQGVVQQVDVLLLIHSSCYGHPLFLTSREINPLQGKRYMLNILCHGHRVFQSS